MKKKIFSILLSLSFLVANLSTAVGAVNLNSSGTNDNISYEHIVTVKYEDIDTIADTAKELLDSGKTLYITEPTVSAEVLAEQLSVPKVGINSYNESLLYAYAIFKLGENYVFENYTALFADGEIESASTYDLKDPFSKAITIEEYNLSNTKKISAENFTNLNAVATSQSDAIESMPNGDASLKNRASDFSAPNNFTTSFSETVNAYDNSGNYYGYIRGTIYVYNFGRGIVNGSEGQVYNLVSSIKAYPDADNKLKELSFNNLGVAAYV